MFPLVSMSILQFADGRKAQAGGSLLPGCYGSTDFLNFVCPKSVMLNRVDVFGPRVFARSAWLSCHHWESASDYSLRQASNKRVSITFVRFRFGCLIASGRCESLSSGLRLCPPWGVLLIKLRGFEEVQRYWC